MRLIAGAALLCLVAVSVSFAAEPVCQSFETTDITFAVLRASKASQARISRTSSGTTIRVCATPSGGARGYHSPDPSWRETPPEAWGVTFVTRTFGNVLLITSKNELHYIHHYYYLDRIAIEIPEALRLRLEDQQLTGDGAPDFTEPAAFSLR